MSASSEHHVAKMIAMQAEAHETSVLQIKGPELSVAVRLRRPGGKIIDYRLLIDARSRSPRVREQWQEHLPSFCPNRHISYGSWFCLNFEDEDPLPVYDEATASVWWKRLLKYLNLQETASRIRRWPSSNEWAHGPEAARNQSRAEACAEALGPRYVGALERRTLRVRRRRGTPQFIQLFDGDSRLYSVWVKARRVATKRQSCPCGSGRPLVGCADHLDRASELPFALQSWEREERKFWDAARNQKCCGSLEDCPLRDAAVNETIDLKDAA